MSVPEFPGGREHSVPPRMAGGCATVFIALLGVVLLLPGLCSLFFLVSHGRTAQGVAASSASGSSPS